MRTTTPVPDTVADRGYPRLRHDGDCGSRVQCHREECRREYRDYSTVEILASGVRLAYCCGRSYTEADIRRAQWRATRRTP